MKTRKEMGQSLPPSDMSTNTSPAKWNGGLMLGWKLSAAALLRIFTLLTSCFILLMIWESSAPVLPRFADNSPRGQKIVNFQVGDSGRASALWNSMERMQESGKKLTEPDESQMFAELDSELHLARELAKIIPRQTLSQGHQSSTRESTIDYPQISVFNLTNATHAILSGPAESDEPKGSSPIQAYLAGEIVLEGNGPSAVNRTVVEDGRQNLGGLSVASVSSDKCDFTRGQWVEDTQRHFYSGKECKAYLADGFACRQTKRPNFDYEKFRWQPEGCDLPPFTSDEFLQRLRNKVVAFIGDSLGRQQFQSLMCMLTGGKNDKRVKEVHKAWGPEVKWAYLFRPTNTTVLFYWSSSLCDVEGHKREGHYPMHLDRPPSFLKEYFRHMHVLILNTGHHWNRGKWEANKWRPYVNGKPATYKKLAMVADAMNFTVHKVVEWIDAELASTDYDRQSSQPAVFVRTLSPRHFQGGEWDSGGTCDNTQFVPKADAQVPIKRYRGPVTSQIAENAVKGTRLSLLNITYLSKFRTEGHISKYGIGKDSEHQDCLHWCLPGIPDVWNEVLYGQLLSHPSLSSS